MTEEYVIYAIQGDLVYILSNLNNKRTLRKDLLYNNTFFTLCINAEYVKNGIIISDITIKNYNHGYTASCYELVYKTKIDNRLLYIIVSPTGDVLSVSSKTYDQLIRYGLIRTPNGRLFDDISEQLLNFALCATESGVLESSLNLAINNRSRELQRAMELKRMQLAEDRARAEKARIYEEAKALYDSAMKKKRWRKPLTKEENDAVIYIQALNKHQNDIAAQYERRCAELKNINYSAYDVDINLDTGLQVAGLIGLTALDFVLDSVVLSAKIRTGNAILNKFF